MDCKKNVLIFYAALLLLLPGCGVKVYNVDLNPNAYQDGYLNENNFLAIAPTIKFAQGNFIDNRDIKDSYCSTKAWKYVPENDLSYAFYDGLQVFFSISNQLWVTADESDIKVDIEIIETMCDVTTGFWVVRFESGIKVFIKFIDSKTNNIVYQQTYEGHSQQRTPAGHMNMLKMHINKAIIDCINKIGMDKELFEKLLQI